MYRSWAVVAFLVVLAPAAGAFAQSRDTGTVLVKMEDANRTPLSGVTVLLNGPLGSRTDISRADGVAYFPGLAPGSYTTTASLEGFTTSVRQLRVSASTTTSVTIPLQLAAVEETVTVAGESPLLDVKRVGVGTLYDTQLIDRAATASGIWAGVLEHIPGLVLDSIDVGGLDSATQQRLSARGSGWDQNSYTLNGSDTTDPDAPGLSLMFYSVDSFEEVNVSTAAHDIEVQVPGVALDMVSKTGSNSWGAATRFNWVDESFVSRNIDAALAARGAAQGNPPLLVRDFDAQAGGPIVRDHAWFFVDYWNFKSENLIVGLPPDELDEITLQNWTLNGTWQISQDHKATLRYFTSRRFQNNDYPASPLWLPASIPYQNSFVDVPQVQYQGVFGPDTFVDVRFSRTDNDSRHEAKHPGSDLPRPDFPLEVPPSLDYGTRTRSGWPEMEWNSQPDRTQIGGNLLHYLAGERDSHDLKLGGQYVGSRFFVARRAPFGLQQRFRFSEPYMVILRNTPREQLDNIHPPNGWTQTGNQYALYAQDVWTLGSRLTVNAGVRYDASRSADPDQRRLESFWPQLGPGFQAADIPGRDPTAEWSDLVVRVGVILDLRGDGRTALKASYARYSFQQGATWPGFINPNATGSEYHLWDDVNGDGVFQFGEQAGLYYRSLFTNSMWDVDPDLQSPITQEIVLGFERELTDDLLMSAQLIHRDTDDKLDDINVGVPYGPLAASLGLPDAYTPVPVTDPGPDGVPGTADDGGPLTLYLQDPDTFGDDYYLITNPGRYGFDAFERYNGLSLVLRKRWSENWQLLASWDIGTARSSTAAGANGTTGAYDSPNADYHRAGLTSWDRTHIVKATGTYLFPEPVGVNLGAFLRVYSGQPLLRWVPVEGYEGLRFGYEEIRAAPPGEDSIGGKRYPTVAVVDVRAEKQFPLGRWGVARVYGDVFNVFNGNAVTSQETVSGPSWGDVRDLLRPRVFRLGFAWDF